MIHNLSESSLVREVATKRVRFGDTLVIRVRSGASIPKIKLDGMNEALRKFGLEASYVRTERDLEHYAVRGR